MPPHDTGDPVLPWMGLGLSSNLSARGRPAPYALHDRHPGAFDYLEYSAPLDLDEARRSAALFATVEARRGEVPVLLHPVHLNLYGPELEPPSALAALAHHAQAMGSPWVGNDLGWWHVGRRFLPGHLYLPPPLTRDGLEDCVVHVQHVQAHLPVPLLIENPALIATRGPLHVLDFLAEVHARTGAGLLLDLGHLLSHQLARGLPLDAGLDRFPLDRVVEIHVAGGVVTRGDGRAFYVDDHPQPVREELFALLDAILPDCDGLRALTYEADGHPEAMALRGLERLRARVPSAGSRPAHAIPRAGGRTPPTWSPRSRPWQVFAQAHGARADPEDPEAARVERAFRQAALAERVDRVFPLSRLLLAGTPDALATFAASEELRTGFEPPRRDPVESFARWARRRLRERPEEVCATVLAFESWAAERLQRAPRRTDGAHEVVAHFPVDLAELLWAAGALRRHLAGRAAAGGVYEASALEALHQVAARAPRRAWRVALRSEAGRVRVAALADAPGTPTPGQAGAGLASETGWERD